MSRLPVVMLNESMLWAKDTGLRKKCRRVDVESREDLALAQALIHEMFRTLYADPSSVALSAPQVGVFLLCRTLLSSLFRCEHIRFAH